MVSRSVLLKLRCSQCVHLYALLDEEQGDNGRPIRGKNRIERDTGWDHRTVKRHMDHLRDAGVIEVRGNETKRGGWSHRQFYVAHNPARGRHGEPRDMPGVWGDPPSRRRPTSRWHEHEHTNVQRGMQTVGPPAPLEDVHEFSSVGEQRDGTHRVHDECDTRRANDERDGVHAVSSVSRSPRYERSEGTNSDEREASAGALVASVFATTSAKPVRCPDCGRPNSLAAGGNWEDLCQCAF
jgi:hypothetical protein